MPSRSMTLMRGGFAFFAASVLVRPTPRRLALADLAADALPGGAAPRLAVLAPALPLLATRVPAPPAVCLMS